MVSTDTSHVIGKRECRQVPRYEICGKLYCVKHQAAFRAQAYPRLVEALREAYSTVHPGMPVEYRIKLAKIGDLIRDLGEL